MILLNNSVMEKMENGFVTSDDEGADRLLQRQGRHVPEPEEGGNIFDLLQVRDDLPEIQKIWQSNNSYYFEKNLRGFSLGISISAIEKVSTFERLLVFLITDLSAIKEIESKLKEKEHLALIGEMAAGIAHEIRNPLASISGSVQFLRRELKLEPELTQPDGHHRQGVGAAVGLHRGVPEFFPAVPAGDKRSSTWPGWWTT